MISGNYKNVSELINVDKNLKIKELSKQFVRDVLVESGYKGYGGDDEVPELTDEQVVETSWRYISLYEDLTGEQFNFDKFDNIKQSLLSNLINQNLIKGGMVVLMAGSDSDREHIRKICDGLDKLEIAWSVRICSAHKQASKCEELINYYNESTEPLLIIAIAGGTDALSGVVSFHSVWPVISCPPDKNNYLSCIENPPGSSNALIIRPENVAKFAAQYFGYINNTYQNKILNKNFQKIEKLKQADEQFLKEDC
jgi:phosphoribosylaminoimidazole carboxylase PurE protein